MHGNLLKNKPTSTVAKKYKNPRSWRKKNIATEQSRILVSQFREYIEWRMSMEAFLDILSPDDLHKLTDLFKKPLFCIFYDIHKHTLLYKSKFTKKLISFKEWMEHPLRKDLFIILPSYKKILTLFLEAEKKFLDFREKIMDTEFRERLLAWEMTFWKYLTLHKSANHAYKQRGMYVVYNRNW